MESKTVNQTAPGDLAGNEEKAMYRALSLLVARGGVFRTDERWVHDALRRLVHEGWVNVNDSTLSYGTDFEKLLSDACDHPQLGDWYKELYVQYRVGLNSSRKAVTGEGHTDVLERVDDIPSTEWKIRYLAQVLAEVQAAVTELADTTAYTVGLLREVDTSLAALESQVHGTE